MQAIIIILLSVAFIILYKLYKNAVREEQKMRKDKADYQQAVDELAYLQRAKDIEQINMTSTELKKAVEELKRKIKHKSTENKEDYDDALNRLNNLQNQKSVENINMNSTELENSITKLQKRIEKEKQKHE